MKNTLKKGSKKTVNSRIARQAQEVKKKKKQKRKLKLQKIFLGLLGILVLMVVGWCLLQVKIRSIVIVGNEWLSDQEIIDLAGIRDYPSTFKNPFWRIEKKLEGNDMIASATVRKKNFFTGVVITVDENLPLFYYAPYEKTVLEDGSQIDGTYFVPTLLNKIPEDVYQDFLKDMAGVPKDVLRKMSEIEYKANDGENLFFISMNDGIYVHISSGTFSEIYDYLDIVSRIGNNKGVLHLERGKYLEPIEE